MAYRYSSYEPHTYDHGFSYYDDQYRGQGYGADLIPLPRLPYRDSAYDPPYLSTVPHHEVPSPYYPPPSSYSSVVPAPSYSRGYGVGAVRSRLALPPPPHISPTAYSSSPYPDSYRRGDPEYHRHHQAYYDNRYYESERDTGRGGQRPSSYAYESGYSNLDEDPTPDVDMYPRHLKISPTTRGPPPLRRNDPPPPDPAAAGDSPPSVRRGGSSLAPSTISATGSSRSISDGPKAPKLLRRGSQSQEDVICHSCDRFVNDDSHLFRIEGRVFHGDCFRCIICDVSLGTQNESFRCGEMYYCYQDYYSSARNKCVFCNETLSSKVITNIHEEHMCAAHDEAVAMCADCGRIVPSQGKARRSSRQPNYIQCDVCQKNALLNEKQAKSLFREVYAVLFREYSFPKSSIVHLALLTLSQMRDAISRSPHKRAPYWVGGFTRFETINCRPTVKWVGVPLGVSQDRVSMMMAHEIMHVYLFQAMNNDERVTMDIEEGLCELLVYLWMTSETQSHKETYKHWEDKMITTSHPIFNHGFWRAKAAFDLFVGRYGLSNALPALLSYVVKHRVLPAVNTA